MNMLAKLGAALLSVLLLLSLVKVSPTAALVAFAILFVVYLRFGVVKKYRQSFPRNMKLKQAWQSDAFGGFAFATGFQIVFIVGVFALAWMAGSDTNRAQERELAERAGDLNRRHQALLDCPVMMLEPRPAYITEERRKEQIEERCTAYRDWGAEWITERQKATLDCIGWQAGMMSSNFDWCRYYDRTPEEPTAEQIATFQQANLNRCREWTDSHPIRRLVELSHLRWCADVQPQQIEAPAVNVEVAAFEAFKATGFQSVPAEFNEVLLRTKARAEFIAKPFPQIDAEATTASTEPTPPATGDDLWK